MAAGFPRLTRLDDPFARIRDMTPETVRKIGVTSRLRREIEAMEYVRARTSIPVPRVLKTHLGKGDDDDGWFVMERLPGDQLGDVWPTMSERCRTETLRQLQLYFGQLRTIRPDGAGWIGSCSRGPAYDHRINSLTACGPFATVGEFHDFLVQPVKDCPRPELAVAFRKQYPDESIIVFAHADASWQNILVDGASGRVTGILDWEMAGFWPEWWEYRKALDGGRTGKLWWVEMVKNIMQDYMEVTLVDMDVAMF